ncbi:hypothetical protein HYH03_000202 [Edaphochlamys debaryana]|uniref:RZ-type domain-containing protein n=1 Tax=Edaphochlamys debaryana TaxID=47281 RepID=A0A836C5Y0_9CHLO|nr:hypothetical protein HYH03_000202 [Edaphochlamys debaryana]|eukprot:KAG2501701.1 hypothetical protein HYH03_000202 [Edaphochlamys debaryana]
MGAALALGCSRAAARASLEALMAVAQAEYASSPASWLDSHVWMCGRMHVYVVGNCGNPVEASRCPECGVTVGCNGERQPAASLLEQLRQEARS